VLIWWVLAGPSPVDTAELGTQKQKDSPKQINEEVREPQRVTGWNQEVVPDDGRLLWESPTAGVPLVMSGLPNNPSGLLVIHQDFWASSSVDEWLRALDGPAFADSSSMGYAETIRHWRDTFQVTEFTRTSIGQYQALDRVHHAVQLEGDAPVAVSLPQWKLIASVSVPDAPSPAAEPQAELQAEAQTETETETESIPTFHYLLARTVGDATEAAWLQLAEPLPTDLADGLATTTMDRVSGDTFDPSFSEMLLDERKLPVRRLLVGGPELVSSAVQNGGQTQFVGTMANLLAYSDQDRQVQLFVNPVTIWNAQGQD